MTDTTRQKYMDAMARRADLIRQADEAFAAGDASKGTEYTTAAAAINPEIDGYQAMMAEEQRYAQKNPAPVSIEAKEKAEDRVETLRRGGVVTFSAEEVSAAIHPGAITDSTTLSTGSIVEPTHVGTNIHDGVGGVSSIVDQVFVQDLTGCSAIEEPILMADMAASSGKVSATAGQADSPADPTFALAKISPYSLRVTSYVDQNLSRLTPVAYEAKIQSIAMRALRRECARLIYNGDGQSTPDMFGIKTAQSKSGTALYKAVDIDAIASGFLDSLVFAYGSDEEIGGNARLFLTKKDLASIGKLRSTDGKRLYEIAPDPGNANTGRIIDGGLIVPYTIGSALTSLTGASAKAQTMVYGDPSNYELGLFGPYSIRIDSSVKAIERMDAILGDAMVGGNLIRKDGFIVATKPGA